MNTVSQIQCAINSKKPISFWYSYSHPDTNRIVEPMSLANGSLVAREKGSVKRFNIDGINLIASEKNDTIKTIDEMINANATMVFTYSLSQPEKVRYASPIEIKGDLVIAVEADTGKYKSFKLEGIKFVDEAKPEKQEDDIKKRLQKALDNKEIIKIRYSYSQPDLERIVVPWSLGEDKLNVNECGVFKSFLLSGIKFVNEKSEPEVEDEEKEVSLEKMIVQAITSLKYREGCSRPAIRKYIIDNFNISSYTLDRKLNIALKRGVDSGVFIQNGQHFKVNKTEKKNVFTICSLSFIRLAMLKNESIVNLGIFYCTGTILSSLLYSLF